MPLNPTAPLPAHLVEQWQERGYLGAERIGWLLDEAVRKWPTRRALVAPSGSYTFAEVAARSDAIALQMTRAGVTRGDVVTWVLGNDLDAVAVPAAIWRIGAVNNPVVAIYRAHEWTFILDQMRPAVIVAPLDHRGRQYTAELDVLLADIGHEPRLRLSDEAHGAWVALETEPDADLPDEVRPAPSQDVSAVLFTSGTTAAPKGVMHSGAGLVHETRMMIADLGITAEDTLFMASPLTHITGLLQGFLVPVMAGACAVLHDRWDPIEAVAAIEKEAVTYMAGATPFLQGIVEEYGRLGAKPTSLRQYTCGGASVPPDLIAAAQDLGISAHRLWGLTELPTATRSSMQHSLESRSLSDGTIAWPVEVQAVDQNHCPLPLGEEGELRLRAPERMVGYVDGSLNAAALDDEGWFYSGDLGRIDADNQVSITGRVKDVINRGGEKFSSRDIEEVLLRHHRVRDVAVVGVPDRRLGEAVAAAVVCEPDTAIDAEVLLAELAEFLNEVGMAKQKIPVQLRIFQDLPRTSTGKLQRFEIVKEWSHG